MKRVFTLGVIALTVVAIVAAIAVVIVVVLAKNSKEDNVRVMYYAMYLGDDVEESKLRLIQRRNREKCSLSLNRDYAVESIMAMNDVQQKYRFILFTDTIELLSPMSKDEAVEKLNRIEPKSHGSPFSQEAVVESFINERKKDDLLVYFIPCNYNYRDNDEDRKDFVEEMEDAGISQKIFIVSNTRKASVVRKLYRVKHVAGNDTRNVALEIWNFAFGSGEKSTTSKPELMSTTLEYKTTKTSRTETLTPTTDVTSTSKIIGTSSAATTVKSTTTDEKVTTSDPVSSTIGLSKTTSIAILTTPSTGPGKTSTREATTTESSRTASVTAKSTTQTLRTAPVSEASTAETLITTSNPKTSTPSISETSTAEPQKTTFPEVTTAERRRTTSGAEVLTTESTLTTSTPRGSTEVIETTSGTESTPEATSRMTETTGAYTVLSTTMKVDTASSSVEPAKTPSTDDTSSTEFHLTTSGSSGTTDFTTSQAKTTPESSTERMKTTSESKVITAEPLATSSTLSSSATQMLGTTTAYGSSTAETTRTTASPQISTAKTAATTSTASVEPSDTSSTTKTSSTTSTAEITTSGTYATERATTTSASTTASTSGASVTESLATASTPSTTESIATASTSLLPTTQGLQTKSTLATTSIQTSKTTLAVETSTRLPSTMETTGASRTEAQKSTTEAEFSTGESTSVQEIITAEQTETTESEGSTTHSLGTASDTAAPTTRKIETTSFSEHSAETSQATTITNTSTVEQNTSASATPVVPSDTTATPSTSIPLSSTTLSSVTTTQFVKTRSTYETSRTETFETTFALEISTTETPKTTETTETLTRVSTTALMPGSSSTEPLKPAPTLSSSTVQHYTTSSTKDFTVGPSSSRISTAESQRTTLKAEGSTSSAPETASTLDISTTKQQESSSSLQTSKTTYSQETSASEPSTTQQLDTTSTNESSTYPTSEAVSTSTITIVHSAETSATMASSPMSTSGPDPLAQRRCLIIGDLCNFGANTTLYEEERDFIAEVSHELLREKEVASVGIWLYGHAKALSSLEESLNNMRTSVYDLVDDLYKIEYAKTEQPLLTAEAIEQLNQLEDKENRVNCLVFLSAQEDTSKLPVLNPDAEKSSIATVVAVGYSGTDLSNVVVPPQGVAVSVAHSYSERDVHRVIAAVLGREYTSTTEPTASTMSTTASLFSTSAFTDASTSDPTTANVHCLFVGDLLNFGRDETAYKKEKQFIINVGRRLFDTIANATRAVWAYGYTDGPTGPRRFLKDMKNSFKLFEKHAEEAMLYKDVENPNLTNPGVINNLNNASDEQRNANCLLFFSALASSSGLKKLNPNGNSDFKRIVVVSLRGIDLSDLVVQPRGEAVQVASDYSESDVTNVLNRILIAF